MLTIMRFDSTHNSKRSAFTLVEILVTVMILSILSSMILFAMTSALEMAKEQQTKSRIARLDREISRLWNGYLSRRVPIRFYNPDPIDDPEDDANNISPSDWYGLKQWRDARKQGRLVALRDLMRLEIPDRITDVIVPPAVDFNGDGNIDDADRPAASKAYWDIAQAAGWDGQDPGEMSNQGAECLYMIVQFHVGNGPRGRSFFSEEMVADVDGDGMPEYVDAWGEPIHFCRWAPGFVSSFHSAPKDPSDLSYLDPFDPHGVDNMWASANTATNPQRFPLHPLIISAGPNRQLAIVTGVDGDDPISFRQDMPNTHGLLKNQLNVKYYIDPYQQIATGKQIGSVIDPNPAISDPAYSASDNIHNHFVETN